MIQIPDKAFCCGCGACADVCPKGCIEYKEDSKGFLYPAIDARACIDCGLCEKVCPLMPANIRITKPLECHAAWARDTDVHKTSSSGAIGQLLAKHMIEQGGVVYGCSAEEPWHVRHVRVDKAEGLAQLRGSKYVQSDTQKIYRQIKEDIKTGRTVLFTGTPCQVSAVKNLFHTTPDNLFLVDLVCHGVPSQKMLNEQFEQIVGSGRLKSLKSLSFRNNTDFALQFGYPDAATGEERPFSRGVWQLPYYREFFECRSFRPSCYSCPYAGDKRASDITIGDFWGIKNSENLPESSKYGMSAVLVNSEKGQKLFSAISESLHDEQRPLAEAVAGNTQLRHSSRYTARARVFQALYPMLPIGTASLMANADRKFCTLLRIVARKAGITK